MNDLTKLTNTQLGDFISLSLVHGTNTQFSYELMHEVAQRLVQTDEIIKAGISNGIHETLTKQSTAFKFRLEDVVKTLDKPIDEPVEEPIEKAFEGLESAYDEVEQPVEEVKPAKKAPKKEKPVEVAPIAQPVEEVKEVEEISVPKITANDLKAKALQLRQENKVSAQQIKDELAKLGAKTILDLDNKYFDEFNEFLGGF